MVIFNNYNKHERVLNMRKKFLSGMLISLLIASSNTSIVNANELSPTKIMDISNDLKLYPMPKYKSNVSSSPITIKINNRDISLLSAKPYIDSNGKLMLPLTSIIKELEPSSKINIDKGNTTLNIGRDTIKLSTNSKIITLNSNSISLSTEPINKSGEIFVPLQFFSDALNKVADFDNKTNIVKINTPEKNREEDFNKALTSIDDELTARKLNNYLNTLHETDNFNGNVLVAKGDTILLNKGYGMADFEQGIKTTPKTSLPIGSTTKQFTAMAIMQLVEKGLINEQDKLSKFIPDFPNGDDITLHHLLTHTSGLVIFNELPEFSTLNVNDSKDINKVIDLFKDKPLKFKPGTKFEYCNSGYLLLGYIVEKVSNLNYEAYLKTNIFKPLNMNNTGMSYKGSEKLYTSKGYMGYLDMFPIDEEVVLSGVYGAGALYSTTEDLYKWNKALETDKLVSKNTLKKILSKHVIYDESIPAYYGYGWMLNDGALGQEIHHGGNTLGFTSMFKKYVDKDLTIIILNNSRAYNTEVLAKTLADISLGNTYEMPKKKTIVKVDSKILNSYVGEYSLDLVGPVKIINEGSRIYFEIPDQVKYEISPESQTKFFFKEARAEILFNTDSSGKVTGIEFHQEGQVLKGTKTN